MGLTFVISLLGVALLYGTLWRYEMAAKETRMQLRRLRRAALGDEAVRPLGRSAAPS
jgi:heme exporter protein C